MRGCRGRAVVIAVFVVATAPGGATAKPAAEWTCRDLLLVEEPVRPNVVYWIEGFGRGDRSESDEVDAKTFERPISMLVEECKRDPGANLRQKIESFFSQL